MLALTTVKQKIRNTTKLMLTFQEEVNVFPGSIDHNMDTKKDEKSPNTIQLFLITLKTLLRDKNNKITIR
jgi:hypothetical protein